MKKVLASGAVFTLLMLPVIAFAWAPGQPIVPQEVINALNGSNATGPSSITFCNLVQLFDNLLQFGVYLSAFVATVMFAYAGFLYVTASARQDNITQAKSIFSNVFIGLLFILTAWIIVNIIINVFVDQSALKFPWNGVQCSTYVDPANGNVYNTSQVQAAPNKSASKASNATAQELTAEQAARNEMCRQTSIDPATPTPSLPPPIDSSLDGSQTNSSTVFTSNPDCRIAFNKSTTCGKDQDYNTVVGGCTSVRDLRPETKDYVASVVNGCDTNAVVTGGSELGHSEKGVYTHGNGYKVDLRTTQGVNQCIEGNPSRFVPTGTRSGTNEPLYVDTQTGAVWVKEGGPDPHWDICVDKNCPR